MIRQIALSCTLSLLPVFAMAQTVGPSSGEREITLSGSGGSDKDFDSGNFSISGDIGWYTSNSMLLGIRQSTRIFKASTSMMMPGTDQPGDL
jgi:hypothetical protein